MMFCYQHYTFIMKRYSQFMMDGAWRLTLLFCFVTVAGFKSHGQSCDSLQCHCDEYDMNPSGIMIGHNHPKGSWMLSYRFMFMQMNDNLSGSSIVSDDMI